LTEPAIRKVVVAMAAQLAAAVPGLTFIIDRAPSEAVAREETPCCLVQFTGEQITPLDQSTSVHVATIDLEICVRAAATGIQERLAILIADAMGALQADRTIGGLVQDIEEQSVTSDSVGRPDVNSAALALNVTYLTPRGNFFTVLGQSAVFP
jgi:hypothetical protein